MAKVLIVRKPDRTIHQVPIGNKANLMAFSNRLPEGQRWSFEVMDEEKAKDLPAIDPNYITAGEAVTKLKGAESRIAELEAMLKEREGSPIGASVGVNDPAANAVTDEPKTSETAPEVIAKIKAATSVKEVKQILGKDERKTVQDAAEAAIASFK